MKKLFILLFAMLSILTSEAALSTPFAELKGRITDKETGEALAGATVLIPDLRLGTVTNKDGQFVFKNLPVRGTFLLEVRFVGYKSISRRIELGKEDTLDLQLETAVIESAEVVITGTPFGSQSRTSSLAVVTMNRDQLLPSGGTNLVDGISRIPGVSQVSTGGAISKPTIRGLGYNRVLTIIDGAREESQQWGDEHGILVDQFSAARVEILKGPASLLYGSDALGGVIHIIDDIMPAEGEVKGQFTSSYSSNGGMTASSGMLQGNHQGWVYRGRLSYRNAYGFGYGNTIVPNAGFNETNASVMAGLNKRWGYAHVSLSRFSTNVGLVEEGPDDEGYFLDEEGQVITKSQARKRTPELPYQHINHYRAALNSNILIHQGQLKSVIAFQRNVRQEFEESSDEAALQLGLNTFTYDVKYAFPKSGKWETTVGLQGMAQGNRISGEEYLIPEYDSQQVGAFFYTKYHFDKGAVNAGVRYDFKQTKGMALEEEGEAVFEAFRNRFSNVSGAVGFAFNVSERITVKGNLGSGFRAPNIAELAANGKHEGTFRYEIGNHQLKPETSVQLDLSIGYEGEKFSLQLNGYRNYIYNYIYPGQFNGELIDYTGEDGEQESLPVYRFVQTEAALIGAEASLDIHPLKALHFENTLAVVKGTNKGNGHPLPFIPATTVQNEIRFEPEIKGLKDSYLKVGLRNVFRQGRFDTFETATDSYTLLDAGLGTSFSLNKHKVNVWLTGQNLTDKRYVNHLNRYKLAGIFNPGRNLSLGVNFSF